MEVVRKKIVIFPIIFSFFISLNVKADLRDTFNKKNLLNKTNCTWNNAQFNEYYPSGLWEERFCLDNKKGTIFRIVRQKDGTERIYREEGFLGKPETYETHVGDGVYYNYISQWSVESNVLYEYQCRTYTKTSTSCSRDVKQWSRGRKR